MEQRLANAWKMTVNESKFLRAALLQDVRLDGRRQFDYRDLAINFGKVDGSSEVHLGNTHVMGFVSGQLVQPYRDRPNEGTLSIFTEFSPMADPSFEPGRPGEFAIELGRIVDRGLRESRAVDTESLCVLAGKLVWSIRIDLHILDNGGNLLDASNIAALAALMTFRRPDCTLGGDDGQEVIVNPPEVREPIPLIIHHLPISVTFAFFDGDNNVVVDPTHFEEAVMGGRFTVTLNADGDICAIQKGGGVGVSHSVIMQCLRIASVKAMDITSKIKSAVESFNAERASSKIKRHSSSVALDVGDPEINLGVQERFDSLKEVTEMSKQHLERLNLKTDESCTSPCTDKRSKKKAGRCEFTGVASNWDPYSRGINVESLKASIASRGTADKERMAAVGEAASINLPSTTPKSPVSPSMQSETRVEGKIKTEKTLKDAVKPKHKRDRNRLHP
uniref:Protein ECERIFERUM 7 n=2 Tax=Kalanchoe fedtschenkoi TaxID=63787 RepID=A0A7N0TIL2_KALFE